MSQVIKGAECAWKKLPVKYKKLYGPRVYTPTHLSLTPPPNTRASCALTLNGSEASPGAALRTGLCNTALGAGSLLGLLTKKLLSTCKEQLMSPEHQAMLNDLVGTEVTVKICNVKKFK